MRGRLTYITTIAVLSLSSTAIAQDYFDDVYYNPKNDTSTEVKVKKQSNYIANMADMDVDIYNRRGEQYYTSEIDTIGSRVENGEDFVYTQQIQKFYNPTVVVDNANALNDVLTNAYGNVEIIINNNGYPVFAPWYGYNWPYYSYAWSPWSWGFNIGPWGWSVGWYDPWYSWNWGWGPSWGWGGPPWRPGPGWGPGPGPGPGPGWGPGWNPRPFATWSPRGNRAVAPRPGWNAPNPPRGNMAAGNPGGNMGRPGGNIGRNPGGMQNGNRPVGVVNNGGRWQYNTSGQTGHRTAGTGVLPGNSNNGNRQNANRPAQPSNAKSAVTNTQRSTNNNNRSVGNSRSTMRSTGGGFSTGGSRSTGGRGGGGGGRHR